MKFSFDSGMTDSSFTASRSANGREPGNFRINYAGSSTRNLPVVNARHIFYHVIISEQQRHAMEGALKKLNISFGSELNPMNFDYAKKQMNAMQKTINKEQSEHGHTRRLRQMEKDLLQSIFDTCLYKIEAIQKQAARENPEDHSIYLKQHSQLIKFMENTMHSIEGVQNKVRNHHEEYMKSRRAAEVKSFNERVKKNIGNVFLTNESAKFYEIKAPKRMTPLENDKEEEDEPQEEGAISALDLLGGDEDDGQNSMNIFEDEEKNEAILMNATGNEKAESDGSEPEILQGPIATSAQNSFREALQRQVESAAAGGDEPILTAASAFDDEAQSLFENDDKPPPLEEGVIQVREPPGPRIAQSKLPVYRRIVYNASDIKKPRILGGGGGGVTYRVVQPSSTSTQSRFWPKVVATKPLTAEDLLSPREPVRPGSSAINYGGDSVPSRVSSVIFRKDYKHPPAPLPADDGTHVLCHLCDNRIMCTRLSNLTNHVRRHSAIKQYQCVHCNYQHNEMAKVRLHMNNNHADSNSSPVDNLSSEMQKMWSLLMEQCFPGYMEQLKQLQPHAANSIDWEKQGIVRNRNEYSTTPLDHIHSCLECGEAVSVNPGQKGITMTEPLVDHLLDQHKEICRAYKCSLCDYINVDEEKTRRHSTRAHSVEAGEAQPELEPEGTHMSLFLYKFFPSIVSVIGSHDGPEEDDFKKTIPMRSRQSFPSVTEGLIKTEEELDDYDEIGSPQVKRSKIDPDSLTKNQVLCELCDKVLEWTNRNTLCSLLAHAKRHFKIKQFVCPKCDYSSSESAHVKNHMQQRHQIAGRPRENNNDYMQEQWLNVMRSCFPPLKDRIDSFKFKSVRQFSPSPRAPRGPLTPSSSTLSPPKHSYHTRRKRVATDFDD